MNADGDLRSSAKSATLVYTTAVFSFPIREIVAINEESFDALLAWLDPNRELAAQHYELIRAGLIRIFVSKGFSDAEDLGDTVINRVMKKLPEIRDTYVGEPVRYFHGVARNVMRETLRRREIATETVPGFQDEVASHTDEYDCLVKCLRFLPREKHELILDYHIYDGRDKVVHHRQMAEELGITEGALRGRAHHLRGTLEKCIGQCLEHIRSNEKQA